MHPWHDVHVDETSIDTAFPVIVEIPKGSTNKYELDKDTGLLRLDRVLYSAVHYPADYGFIPRTYCDDGDPLDVLVLGQEPVFPLTIVQARAIGVMRMRDEKGVDDKIVAVNVRDPSFADYTDRTQLPAHLFRQVRQFFEDYKVLEDKAVVVEDLLGPLDAIEVIRAGLALYRTLAAADAYVPGVPLTYRAICSWVANHTPGFDFMCTISFSSPATRDRWPVMCGCMVRM